MRTQKGGQNGFTLMELLIALLIILILIAVVIFVVQGFIGGARKTAMEGDIHTVQTASDGYYLRSGKAPTSDGTLPPAGQYFLIEFEASFVQGGRTWSFYPDALKKLPRHWDEAVWRLDSRGDVSVNMDPQRY